MALLLAVSVSAQNGAQDILNKFKGKAVKTEKPATKTEEAPAKEEPKATASKGALPDGMFVLRQSYQLHDEANDEYFGMDGKDEFGATYSVGFFYKGHFCASGIVAKPWAYDSAIEEYTSDYTPVVSQTQYIELGSASAAAKTVNFGTEEPIEIEYEAAYLFSTPKVNKAGFGVDLTPGEKSGSIVWVTNADKNKLAPQYTIEKATFSSTNKEEVTAPANAVGGVFFVPSGNDYIVSGIINRTDEGWCINFVFDRYDIESLDETIDAPVTPAATSESDSQESANSNSKRGSLTPVKK